MGVQASALSTVYGQSRDPTKCVMGWYGNWATECSQVDESQEHAKKAHRQPQLTTIHWPCGFANTCKSDLKECDRVGGKMSLHKVLYK